MLQFFFCVFGLLSFTWETSPSQAQGLVKEADRELVICVLRFFFGLENHGKHPLFHRLQEKKHWKD